MSKALHRVLLVVLVMSMLVTTPILAAPAATYSPNAAAVQLPASQESEAAAALAPSQVITFTILHTNDFHGNLQFPGGSSSTPGMARTAQAIEDVRADVGPENVLLVDAGDIMQGTLLSNLFHGESTIDVYNQVGYDVATFGNHEFDWGQTVLMSRTNEAAFPFISANIVVSDSGSCDTAGWTSPAFVEQPFVTMTVGVTGSQVVVGFIGVTSPETPFITVDWATAGLCFKDPAQAIEHYYPELAAEADVIVVLSHLGNTDGGYGYGFPVYGDLTLAQRLADAGTPVNLIIGGHSHTDIADPLPPSQIVAGTTVVQAHYAGRKVGRADIGVDPSTGAVNVSWHKLVVAADGLENPDILAAIDVWANNPWYQEQINRVVGYTNVPITCNYNGDSLMGDFVDDAVYNNLNNDGDSSNDVDIVFNNAGGLRADITFPPTMTLPFTLTHGGLYTVLPFGNQTIVGDITGDHILELLNQSATLFKGALQVSGIRYTFYRYQDALPGPQPWAWGAYDITIYNRATSTWEPLDLTKTYRIATNEFLAPAGQDGYAPFKYVTNISYWGDMLDSVESWVAKTYTITNPYSGTLDGRINRDGDDSAGSIIPVTVLHNNDPHGNLMQSGNYPGLTNLATLIGQERAHNPTRTLLFNAGDTVQGDSMSYYFKTAPQGEGADGTPIVTPTMHIQPAIAAMNALGYDAMVLGNHEFNFGNQVFTTVLSQAEFPIMGANVYDDGRYGIGQVPVVPDITLTLPGPSGDINVAVLGLTNPSVPNYELPSNIIGLSFTNPISEALNRLPALEAANDLVLALTHIGFTIYGGDTQVDTVLAAETSGIDAIIGGHSHTDPTRPDAPYKYLPGVIPGADGEAVLVSHAYRYNNYLGQVILGLRPDGLGGYEVVTRAGRAQKVDPAATAQDPAILAIIQPYADMLASYQETVLGHTTVPIDALQAFTQETNGANMQADASVYELAQHGINVDFHISGAMTNKAIAAGASITNPYTITVGDMFTLMPYENSLVALQMNGPQLKAVLERGYRNYYYYKYVPGRGGYSYYTTCMLDVNEGGQVVYRDTYPQLPDGNNVAALIVNGEQVDFLDATKYYTVSTVNYLAAGSCNFNDDGVTLWPLDQIVADTQFYVRDAVIDYTAAMGDVAPVIEGRLTFLNQFAYLPIIAKGLTVPTP